MPKPHNANTRRRSASAIKKVADLSMAQDQDSVDDVGVSSQADGAEATGKASKKKTGAKAAKPVPARVYKPRKSKTVAKAKLSARGKKKQNSTGMAAKKGPGPRKTFNREIGGYGAEYEAEAIMDSKLVGGKREYLVKWVGWPKSSNTWEPEANLHNAATLIAAFDVKYPAKP